MTMEAFSLLTLEYEEIQYELNKESAVAMITQERMMLQSISEQLDKALEDKE